MNYSLLESRTQQLHYIDPIFRAKINLFFHVSLSFFEGFPAHLRIKLRRIEDKDHYLHYNLLRLRNDLLVNLLHCLI